MISKKTKKFFVSLIALVLGAMLGIPVGIVVYKLDGRYDLESRVINKWKKIKGQFFAPAKKELVWKFSSPVTPGDGVRFGTDEFLTFETHRNGTFTIDSKTGVATQISESYLDAALIRSTDPLPETYKIQVTVGGVNYGLEHLAELSQDPKYPEGPLNENGCYLLTIVDELPDLPHTNTWWHQHRKAAVDVDNNVWGHGMPFPIFMVYFNKDNRLNSFDAKMNDWTKNWTAAVHYDPNAFYVITIEKTHSHFILTIADEQGGVLRQGKVSLANIWHEDGYHPDYFVIGDPHENYYQGSMKIKEIRIWE